MKNEHTRFLEKVKKTDSCWEWTGSKYRGGYGHFRRFLEDKWKMYKAHRYSYEYFKGSAKGFLVCHYCDNPSCVNPDHLWLGTHKQNHKDMQNKGRMKMIRNTKHKLLNLGIARNIREYKNKYPKTRLKAMALEWDTSIQQVSRILRNEIWPEES